MCEIGKEELGIILRYIYWLIEYMMILLVKIKNMGGEKVLWGGGRKRIYIWIY